MARLCYAAPPLPVGQAWLSSGYGIRPGRTTGEPRMHAGLDFAAARGTPVYSVLGGVVEQISREDHLVAGYRGYGNCVVVRHDDEGPRWTFYAHLNSISAHEGQHVEPWTQVGTVGNTSNGKFSGMAVHLHMELRHARRDGSSPFPGLYGTLNEDPQPWLESHGVFFDQDQEILGEMRRRGIRLDGSRACPPGQLRAWARTIWRTATFGSPVIALLERR